jgi:hypothetical protein
MRTRRCYALLALVALVLPVSACGGGERAERRQLTEIPSALAAEGLVICEEIEPGTTTETAEDELAFTVAIACGEDDDQADVAVIEWSDETAREAALRRFDVQSRPPARNHGITWALVLFTVHVSGERDDAVVERLASAMARLGAS